MKHEFRVFKRKNKKIWYFYYYEGKKRINKSTGKTIKHDAEEYARSFLGANKQSPDLTLGEFARDFFLPGLCGWLKKKEAEEESISTSTRMFYRVTLEKRIIPRFGHIPLKEIKPAQIERWLASFDLAEGTKRNLKKPLNHIFKEALRKRLIKFNPLASLEKLSPKPKKERSVLTPQEIKNLFPESREQLLAIWEEEQWAILCYTVITTGMRSGEVRALKWEDIDFEKKIVTINKTVRWDLSIGQPKGKYHRAAFLNERTVNMLAAYRKSCGHGEPEDLLFRDRKAQPINGQKALLNFRKALNNAEIETEGRVLDLHALRHSYNTLMRPILPPPLLRLQIGHKSSAMTEHYDHTPTLQRLRDFKKERVKINAAFS